MDDIVVRGKLKLKKTAGGKIEKKKRNISKSMSPERTEAMIKAGDDDSDGGAGTSSNTPPPPTSLRIKTKAELAFEKRQAKLQAERIDKKAQVSHRERVDKFNKYLENMTEINDIPKVSWTK